MVKFNLSVDWVSERKKLLRDCSSRFIRYKLLIYTGSSCQNEINPESAYWPIASHLYSLPTNKRFFFESCNLYIRLTMLLCQSRRIGILNNHMKLNVSCTMIMGLKTTEFTRKVKGMKLLFSTPTFLEEYFPLVKIYTLRWERSC